MSEEPIFLELPVSADSRPITGGERTVLWLFGLAFGSVLFAGFVRTYVPQSLSIVFFFVFLPFTLVLHELGHALMARALGWRVGRISIGFGPVLWRRQIGETLVLIRVVPLEGYVVPAPSSARGARLKSALIYAAGPGAELALLAALIGALGFDTVFNQSGETALVALKTLAISILFSAGFNLLPYSSGGGVSDGLGILLSPFMGSEVIEQRLLTLEELDIEERAREGYTDDAIEQLDALIAKGPQGMRLQDKAIALLAMAGRHDEARARLDRRLAGRPIVSLDDVGLLHLDALTGLAATQPDPVNVDLALNRALRLLPDNTSLKVTRAIADIRRGRTVAGGNLLAEVYRDIDEPVDRARALGWLAVAANRLGHADATRRFSEAFEHVNRDAGLAAAVRRALERNYQ